MIQWHTHFAGQIAVNRRRTQVKILVDENMPYAAELFSRLGDVQAVPAARSRARRWRMPMR